jgi:hypothetical protein
MKATSWATPPWWLSGVPASVPATTGTPAATAARNEATCAWAAGRARSLIQPGTFGPARMPCGAEKVGV